MPDMEGVAGMGMFNLFGGSQEETPGKILLCSKCGFKMAEKIGKTCYTFCTTYLTRAHHNEMLCPECGNFEKRTFTGGIDTLVWQGKPVD